MNLIGVDIGGTKCAVTLSTCYPINIIDKISFETKTKDRGPKEIIDEIIFNINNLIDKYKIKIDAIGISCGGPLNSKEGIILSPPNLPNWDFVPIVKILQDNFCVKTFLQNDANACALVEWKLGAGRNAQNMVFLTMGTGMGAGIIADGKLITGANDNAGEIGHIKLSENGPLGYGKIGSFEGFCSGAGIAKYAKMKLNDEDFEDIDTKTLAERAKKGDEFAKEVFKEVGEKLGEGISIIVDTLNPELIVIGSIFNRCEEFLRPSMEMAIEREALNISKNNLKVVKSELSESIGDYAAVMVAIYGLKIDDNNDEEADLRALKILDSMVKKHNELSNLKDDILKSYEQIKSTYKNGGKLLICGNGGSSSDADHIVGELMKGFYKKRPLKKELRDKLNELFGKEGEFISNNLQSPLCAISFSEQSALTTAFLNDVNADTIYAQKLLGYGKKEDTLLGISTSGNSKNVLYAAKLAKALGIATISLTGEKGGELSKICDVNLKAPQNSTPDIQECHLIIYHALCAMVEEYFFKN